MTDGSMRAWGRGGVGEADGGGSGLRPSRDSKSRPGRYAQCNYNQLFLSDVPRPYQGSSSLRQQPAWLGIRVESDGKDAGPPARGPELPPARLGRQWEAELSSVYPGYALPEQMGACHCCQPGTGLTPSYCQVASDLRARRGACLVWLFTRASLSG